MSDSMGKAVWQAAQDGDEAELRRLIERGGNVNWRPPDEVRRRMCLAWAPASSPPLLLRPPSPPRQRPPDTAPYPHSPGGAPPRRPAELLAHASSSHGARRTPACSPIRLTPLALEDGSCVRPGKRTHSSDDGLKVRARRVRPTPSRVLGDRQHHERKSEAPSPKHTPWVGFHVVISFVSSLLSSEQRTVSFAYRGIRRPPRDRQASSRRRRQSDSPNQIYRQDGPRLRTGSGP
jgi:hypothetical protein